MRYHIEAANVDAIEPKDTVFQVEEVQKALEAHYSDYELYGRRPLPFSAAEPGEASEEVNQAKKELLALLKSIEGSGSFATSGARPFIHPGLHIQGIGEIGLPLASGQARDIIEQARRAPFGKGSRTITDTTVRSAWEIDAALLSFHNKEWEKTMRKIVKDILTELELGEGDPIEKEEEGYTGNAGMTMEYWYHYGALLLWPKSRHLSLLVSRPVPVRLQWLEYYLRHWGEAGLAPQESARRLLASLAGPAELEEKSMRPDDFSVVATAFTRLGDEGFLKQQGETLLAAVFDKIKVEGWLALLQQYKPESFHPIFQKAADTDDAFVLRHLTDILMALDEPGSAALAPFALHHIRRLPDYLGKARLHKLKESTYYYGSERPSHKETISALVENVLALSIHAEADADWVKAMLERIAGRLPRKYANEVLAPILLSRKYNDRVLAKALYETCLRDFQSRTAVKPSPPPDWSRDVPESTYYQKVWDILAPFLRSPTQQVFDYQANQSYRTDMERAVKNITIDLKMETIRKGSPHTLRLTKTQAAYERELKKWKEDVALLGRLEEEGIG